MPHKNVEQEARQKETHPKNNCACNSQSGQGEGTGGLRKKRGQSLGRAWVGVQDTGNKHYSL